MRNKLLPIIAILLIAITPLAAKTKIACVGNSITFGHNIPDRNVNSYPAQLQRALGDDYLVQNFGHSGRTLLSKGNAPYIKSPLYKKSLDFNPDIVLIKLGTNDSKAVNMVHFAEFEADYKRLIESYKALPTSPRIILVTPVICYRDDVAQIYDPRMVEQVAPAIERVAYDCGVEIIDGHSIFGSIPDTELMPDLLHPSAAGAAMMVDIFKRHITAERDTEYSLLDQLEVGNEFNYHGYKGHNIVVGDTEIKVVEPKVANAQHSWIQRSRAWGDAPQFELRLLELGYHLVYCDCTDIASTPKAMARWSALYKLATKGGLAEQSVVEGCGQGYDWYMRYPSRVATIYTDTSELEALVESTIKTE